MMQYRKKPVVIEAFRWKYDDPPEWFLTHDRLAVGYDPSHDFAKIETLEGVMTANPGDYIIKGVQGEIYPCKADIFNATYDPVEETP